MTRRTLCTLFLGIGSGVCLSLLLESSLLGFQHFPYPPLTSSNLQFDRDLSLRRDRSKLAGRICVCSRLIESGYRIGIQIVCHETCVDREQVSIDIMTRAIAALLLVCACIVAGVAATLEDGFPRPANLADEPSTSYGPEPKLTVVDSGAPVGCNWYGFSSPLFADTVTAKCQATLRTALTNETSNLVSELSPYVYYTLVNLIDTATNDFLCYQGCFELNFATPPVSAPPPGYIRGPALAPEPAMAPVSESPYESPHGAPPAMSSGY